MALLQGARWSARLLAGTILLQASGSAQFSVNNARIPANGGFTENVDFGDIDLDGDWDVALANGGDFGNQQNEAWINDGFLQGGTLGNYTDETSTRFPALLDDSRDIEFVDFDEDGDLDIYVSNTAQISNQGNRWWANDGLKQGGTLGFYTDETATRWVNLGVAGPTGSSIAPTQLIGGSFIDWSCDCDFGDLDNDGDMDLVHSSYGGSFGGAVPTRIFLNDGDGHFEEFNPSGFQIVGVTIAAGNPGIWCEGTVQLNTSNTDGTFCDVSSTALDIDVGDIDGDFDLDILHGARNEAPRMFANRLDASVLAPANGGQLWFRDVTDLALPPGYYAGGGHYEQEMGDMDRDGDLDVYGLNWFSNIGLEDVTIRNGGNGIFNTVTTLAGSGADDNEGDFLDYDNDGDLDLYVANFSGQDKLYRNDGGPTNYTLVSLPAFSATSLDADTCDTDGDGDYDVLVAEDGNASQTFLENTTGVADTRAPYIPRIEVITGPVTAQAAARPVRAHVYDNAAYYVTWYNPTQLIVEVDGVQVAALPARSSGGQVFRAGVPGNLVGNVCYWFRSSDKYGNTTDSRDVCFRSQRPFFVETHGREPVDGEGEAPSAHGDGTPGLAGTPRLEALSEAFAGTTHCLLAQGAPRTPFVLTVWSDLADEPWTLGGRIRLDGAGDLRHFVTGWTDADGRAVVELPIAASVPPGTTAWAQFGTRDGIELEWATSPALEIVTR